MTLLFDLIVLNQPDFQIIKTLFTVLLPIGEWAIDIKKSKSWLYKKYFHTKISFLKKYFNFYIKKKNQREFCYLFYFDYFKDQLLNINFKK